MTSQASPALPSLTDGFLYPFNHSSSYYAASYVSFPQETWKFIGEKRKKEKKKVFPVSYIPESLETHDMGFFKLHKKTPAFACI